ncbi:MAG: hypothetical protein R3B84_23000 [Zavarzinella sp.]
MPLNVPLTEEMVRNMAPDENVLEQAAEIVAGNRILNPGVSADGTWLLAEAQGTARDPYYLSADFIDPNNPVFRTNSPSRFNPDKYSLGLLLAYIQNPDSFTTQEPSDDLVFKREKKLAADDRKKFGPSAPKRPTKKGIDKAKVARADALDHADHLLTELVATGDWFATSKIEKIEKTAKSLADVNLNSANMAYRNLLMTCKMKGISDDERKMLACDAIGKLWGILNSSRAYIRHDAPAGEASEAVYYSFVDEVLGLDLHASDLIEKGFVQQDMTLLELAYERTDDDARQQRIELSNLINVATGEIYHSYAVRAYRSVNQILEQPSYAAPMVVSQAAVVPFLINPRIRWDRSAEQGNRDYDEALASVYQFAATDFSSAIERFRQQLMHPLAPQEAVFLLKPTDVGRVRDQQVIADEEGQRIVLADRRKGYSNIENLLRGYASLAKEQPAVLIRLFYRPLDRSIVGLPLAALTEKVHLRLGL